MADYTNTINYLTSLANGNDKTKKFVLPTTRDFRSTELPYSLKNADTADLSKMLYFIERPYSDTPGYYAEDSVFVVKGRPILDDPHLGSFDSDTLYFSLSDIDDNNATIVYNDSTFTIKDYLQKSSFSFSDSDTIGVRFIGINSPETNKYTTISRERYNNLDIISVSKDTANSNTEYYLFDSLSNDYYNDEMKFIKVTIDGVEKMSQITPNVVNGKVDTNNPYKYIYKVATDAVDGARSQLILEDLVSLIKDKDLVVMLDHASLNSKLNDYPTTYKEIEDGGNAFEQIKIAIESLSSVNHGPYYSGFSNYGQDGYGRFLGCMYVKTHVPGLPKAVQELIGEQWINVTKYLLYYYGKDFGEKSNDIELSFNPNSPLYEDQFNFVSSAFKVWTYDKKKYTVIDLLDNISNDSITRQRELQKSILGRDFDTQLKDWTVMIGDCVFMVPPTSIRCITRNSAESVPLIRSRGSAIKELPQSERIIEMTLYFNDKESINGVKVNADEIFGADNTIEHRRFDENTLLPVTNENSNFEEISYYMNGLRALISMFKLCPFMPITNTYINDSLHVDAVALSALNIATVPNYPKCIAATIQLMEFNYHAYMSELPFTGDETAETLIRTNIFEKCIDFDALRYYYQKPLYRGEVASRYPFDSQEYLNLTYGSKTALQPVSSVDDSSVEFYFPDSDHLNKLLQAKIEAINNPIKTQRSVTDDVKEWATELGKLYPLFESYINSNDSDYIDIVDFILHGPVDHNGTYIFDSTEISHSNLPSALSSILSSSSYSYDELCEIHSSKPNSECKYKFQLCKSNSYLRKYYNNNTSYGVSWKYKPGYYVHGTLGCDVHFDMASMFFDSFLTYCKTDLIYSHSSLIDQNEYGICGIEFNIKQSLTTSLNNIINFAKNVSIDIGENINSWLSDNGNICLYLSYTTENPSTFINDTQYLIDVSFKSCNAYEFIKYCFNFYTVGVSDNQFELPSDVMQDNVMADKQATDVDTISTFKFVKYPNDSLLESLIVTNISASINNNLSRVYLKALDGYAPQYLGGQDTIIELSMMTDDAAAASAINLLPKLSAEYMRNYHLILSCCPLRINTAFTRMLGVNEVLVETVDISTVKNHPGLYEINMRLISMDRTVRNKEALKNLDINNAGSRVATGTQNYTVRDYFDIRNKISAAEVYPDLELPTLSELELYGFQFIKYKMFDSGRVYPDPDFYFVYGATVANKVLRDTLLRNFEPGDNRSKTFTYSDYLGGKLNIDITQDKENCQFTVDPESYNDISLNELGVTSDAEDIINRYASYVAKVKLQGTQLKLQNTQLAFKNNDAYFAYISVDDYTNLVNLIDDLKSYNYWNFSSDTKGLLKEPQLTALSGEHEHYITNIKDVLSLVIDKAAQYNLNIPSLNNVLSDSYDSDISLSSQSSLINLNDSYRENIDFLFNLYAYNNNDNISETMDNIKSVLLSIADSYTGNTSFVDDDSKLNKKSWQFNCFRGSISSPVPIFSSENTNIKTLGDVLNTAYAFGPFGIQTYSGEYIRSYFAKDVYKNILNNSSNIIDDLYANKRYFLNPYIMQKQHICYQYLDKRSTGITIDEYNSALKAVNSYKYALLYNTHAMVYESILNYCLVYLMLVYNNILISHTQCLAYSAQDAKLFEKLFKLEYDNPVAVYYDGSLFYTYAEVKDKNLSDYTKYTVNDATAQQLFELQNEYKQYYDNEKYSQIIDELKSTYDTTVSSIIDSAQPDLDELYKRLTDSHDKIDKGNYIISAIVYLSGTNSPIFEAMLRRDYDYLNDLLSSSTLPQRDTNNVYFNRFILSLAGRGEIDSIEDIGSSEYTVSDFAGSIIDEKFYLDQVNDPYTYTRDSFYDMITSDMRGRMCRAFPTFYLLFVDEGRDIGWWKLNDNFYNMSSINEITVTKSRKIAADTCTVSMTNMFKTFTTDDEDGKEMSYDLETLASMDSSFWDVWDSIMSPRKLFLREYSDRLEQNPIDRAQLKPGVRMHCRMGYGSDAYSLPVVFNGVVAEVSTGEVVNIICQGDGVELTNPILEDFISSEDITGYETIAGVRQIQNYLVKGATPKTILTKFLTVKGRWLENIIRNVSNGRFFDDNPFGITHFGDPDFNDIFGNSECTQNIYEATSSAPFNGGSDTYLTQMQHSYNTTDVPKVSTKIAGKSYWDIMHVMASISNDYIASVAPFGLRSTIFYGLPHYYYAYEYMKDPTTITTEDGSTYTSTQIKEKRKPFQQYHIYTSYSDIIENNISASAKYMKTNAVGLYYQKGTLGSEHVKKVGPVFADIDIYSEYQKSMTVDTTFTAQGVSVPIVGDLIPFLNNLSTELKWFGNNEEEIAWRITARALKDSVKEMYQGELVTIGDPSVKPYDIAYISDIYENMCGGCEVEAVTHILSSQTGFTTSIYVDPMIDIDNRYYQTAHAVSFESVKNSLIIYTATVGASYAFSRNVQPITKLATQAVTNLADSTSDHITKILKLINVDDQYTRKITGWIQNANILGNTDMTLQFNSINKMIESLKKSKVEIKSADDIKKLLNKIGSVDDIDTDQIIKLFTENKDALLNDKNYSEVNKIINDTVSTITNTRNSTVSSSLNTIVDNIKNLDIIKSSDEAVIKGALEVLDKTDTSVQTRINAVSSIIDSLDDAGKVALFESVGNNVSGVAKSVATSIDDMDKVVKTALKADDMASALQKATYIARGSNLIVLLVSMVAEFLVEAIIAGTVNNNITRWLRDLETLRIYPLTKNGKVYTAGLNGSRGIVVGSSTYDQQGWLQNSIIDLYDNMNPFAKFVTSIFIGDMEDMGNIITTWKNNNGMSTTGVNADTVRETTLQYLSAISDGFSVSDSTNHNRLLLNRIKTLSETESDTDKDVEVALATFTQLYVSNYDVAHNDRLNRLLPLRTISENIETSLVGSYSYYDLPIFTYYHEQNDINNGRYIEINYNDSIERLPYYCAFRENGVDYNDLPLVCADMMEIFYNIVKQLNIRYPGFKDANNNQIQVCVTNALIPGYSDSWHSTGYSCNFYVKNVPDSEVDEILYEMEDAMNNIFVHITDKEKIDGSTLYNISVYPECVSGAVSGNLLASD